MDGKMASTFIPILVYLLCIETLHVCVCVEHHILVKRGFVVYMKYNNGSHIVLLKDPQLIRYKMVPIVHVAAAAVLQQPPAAGRHQNRRSNELNWFQGRSPRSLPRRGRHVVTTLISTKPSQFQVCRNYKIFAFQTRDSCQSRDQPAAVSSQSPVVRVELASPRPPVVSPSPDTGITQ